MISVWPMAMTPTTITCCRISEKFWPLRKRSDWDAKNTHAASSAITGPKRAMGGMCSSMPRSPVRALAVVSTDIEIVANPKRARNRVRIRQDLPVSGRSAPAGREAELGVLARDAGMGLVGDQRHAGVGVAGHPLAALGVGDAGFDAELRHLQRVLLRGRRDHAGLDVPHPGAAAVYGHDQDALLLAGGFERLKGAGCRRFVNRIHDVDVRRLLQAVLHGGLPLGLIALRILAADDAGIALLDAVALQESVVTQLAHGDARSQVQRRDPGGPAAHCCFGVLPDQHAGLDVLVCTQRVRTVP